MKKSLSLDFLQHHFAPSAILLMKISHLFCDCIITKCLWKNLQLKSKENVTLLPLTRQSAIFCFLEADCQSFLIENHILFISKLYIYKSRKRKFLSSTSLLIEISKTKNIEKKVASVNVGGGYVLSYFVLFK